MKTFSSHLISQKFFKSHKQEKKIVDPLSVLRLAELRKPVKKIKKLSDVLRERYG